MLHRGQRDTYNDRSFVRPMSQPPETTEQKELRFLSYYVDYLVKFDTVAQYATHHGLTQQTAKHRIAIGEKLFQRRRQNHQR